MRASIRLGLVSGLLVAGSALSVPAHAHPAATASTVHTSVLTGRATAVQPQTAVQPALQPQVVRTVATTVSLRASTQQAAVGTTFTLSGTVKPAKAGVVVQRQRLVNGRWTSLGSARTNAKGVWTMTVQAPRSPQTIVYRAVAPRTVKGTAASTRVTVKVVSKTAAVATPNPSPKPEPEPTSPPLPKFDAVGPGNRILGADIAHYQHPGGKPIDFKKMYRGGVRFVFIKASDGSALGHSNAEPWFARDRREAQAAGILTGFYHYGQIPDTDDRNVVIASARLQASLARTRLASVGGYGPMDLPYVLDW
jgi:hypothetical protein